MANIVDVSRVDDVGTSSPESAWEMSRMDHVRLPAGAVLTEPPGPLWALVLEGEFTLEVAFEAQTLAEGDAVLIDARTAHRLTASERHEESTLVVADLRMAVPVRRLSSPLTRVN